MTQTTTSLATAEKLPLGRRGRPKLGRDAALSNHLLLVAREVFFEHGLGNSTIDMVAQRAGMSKPTVYRSYKDKHELFEAVMQASMDAWAEGTANNPVVEYKSLEEGIRNFVRVQVRANLSPEFADLTRLIFAEHKRFPDLSRQLLEKAGKHRIVSIVEHIRRFAVIDGVPCRDPESVANALRGMVSGWLQVRVMSGEKLTKEDQEQFIDRVVELIMPGRPHW